MDKGLEKLLEAFIIIVSIDIDYLSYKGQEKWNELVMEKEIEGDVDG